MANKALSCNFKYFKLAKTIGMATLSEFLTDDKIKYSKQKNVGANQIHG